MMPLLSPLQLFGLKIPALAQEDGETQMTGMRSAGGCMA
jgi:hypothetical protein